MPRRTGDQPFAVIPSRRRTAALPLLVIAAWACGAPPGAPSGEGARRTPRLPLFTTPTGLEVLVEGGPLAPPGSDAPNRFFRGWRPAPAAGPAALRATAGGAGFQFVTLRPEAAADAAPRFLVVDLAGGEPGALGGHVEVQVDRRAPSILPLADPLRIPLPAALEPGRHLLMLRSRTPRQRPVVALAAAIRPASAQGGGRLDGEDLVQVGPSIVDTAARPGAGAKLSGDLCARRRFTGTGPVSVELVTPGGRKDATWSGTGGLTAWLGGCRRIELAPLAGDDPVRVRFTALGRGGGARWRGWHWSESAPESGRGPKPERPGAATEPPRVVILYVLDALRADAVGHLGAAPGASPTLDRLARAGHTFREHRSTAPNTLLSLRHLFSGRILVDADAWRALGSGLPTLAETFRDAGFRTGLFSGNSYLAGPFGLARGFEHASEAALFRALEARDPGVNRNAEQVHAAALAWLDGLPAGSRAFLYLHTIHPHNPYAPPADLERAFAGGIPSTIEGTTPVLRGLARGRLAAGRADRERLRALYAASLAYNDREIERFLAALGERYDERELLLAVTSDHGEELFDHGGVLHGYTLYEELLRIPLVVWSPGRVVPGETVAVTDALDLHATLVALAAGDAEGSGAEGRSLLGRLTGASGELPERLHFAASDGPPGGAFAVRWGAWKLVWVRGSRSGWAMGLGPARSWDREYYFDLAIDPDERVNLAGKGGVREQWLRTRLRLWVEERLAEGRGASEAPPVPPLDDATERRLRALGYLD